MWGNGIWSGNSPDLNLIENLWPIVQQEGDLNTPAISTAQLKTQVKTVWGCIKAIVLESLVAGMLQRMRDCVALKGGYVGD